MHNCTRLSIVIMSSNVDLTPNFKSSHSTEFCEIFLVIYHFQDWVLKQHLPEIGFIQSKAQPMMPLCRLKDRVLRDRYSGTLSINSLCRCPRLKPGLIIAPSLPHSIMNNHIKTKHKGWTTKASSSCLTKPVKIHLSRYIILVLPPNPADQSDPIEPKGR